jgi:hypothetical protein
MGKLVKNHWARLVVLFAAAVQVGGSIEGIFWPKVTWDFFTNSLTCLVKPVPVLQIVNLVLGILVLAWEWPLPFIAGSMMHRSIHARLIMYSICASISISLYQSHNSILYYGLAICGYASALSDNEVSTSVYKELKVSNRS